MPKPMNVAEKLISSHLVKGEMRPGEEIGIKIDHTLTQDATGTLVMLELEAMDVQELKTETSVQYVDHNLLESDFKNADDHLFLQTASEKFGLWYSRAGNGVSHPVHMERFGKPGKTMAGSDSHTPAGGSMGMLAIGAGGLDVALAMMGEPFYFKMPKILGVKLVGKLPDWVSAKDVILEMLRRYDVKGCRGMIVEYYGPGLECLSAMDRHVITNMGTEVGATTSVFPADGEIKRFLGSQGRGEDYTELVADDDATYDLSDEIDLSKLEPLIALPSSPGKVVTVRSVAGTPVHQVIIGSSANPGIRDYWVVGEIVKGQTVHSQVTLDINPASRQALENVDKMGSIQNLVHAGARINQTGCMGCIGMGQAPATGTNSLRTFPRNFPGRSGTINDAVYLCSPETGVAAALTGEITDPRDLEKKLGIKYPKFQAQKLEIINTDLLSAPPKDGRAVEIFKGPNIKSIPELKELQDEYKLPVALKLGDDISTDEILQGGNKVLPYRSNIPEISKWVFNIIDPQFSYRVMQCKQDDCGFVIVAGENYAQGSSREHAALAPRYLGQVAAITKSYARIGWQNLVNYGIVPFEFVNKEDYDDISQEDVLKIKNIHKNLADGKHIVAHNTKTGKDIPLTHRLSERQIEVICAGGMINYMRKKNK